MYNKLLNVDAKNSTEVTRTSTNNENSNHLKFIHDDNTSSIFGYDGMSVQRDICPFEFGTHDSNIRQIDDSISNLSERKKRIIVRIVTIFSIVLFLICFGMIAITLRMSEKIDAESENLMIQP